MEGRGRGQVDLASATMRAVTERRIVVKIAIIYHSETGNTKAMAELVPQGCLTAPGVEAKCMPVDDGDQG